MVSTPDFDSGSSGSSPDMTASLQEFDLEVWKDVVGFDEYFQVSNFGNVYSKRTNKVLKQTVSRKGYSSISTRIGGRNGKCYNLRIHRLVAEAFIPNPDVKDQVNHIDGDKLNNHVDNLEWNTQFENMQHAFRLGLMDLSKLEINNINSRLISDEDVNFIKVNFKSRNREFGYRALSRKFKVSKHTIYCIVNNIRYKEVL